MTKAPSVHQFTAIYAERDAVGQHTLAVDRLLQRMGCQTSLFAERGFLDSSIEILDFRKHHKYPPPDLVLYQMSTGSPVGDYLATRTEPLVLNYHNITPSEHFASWAPQIGQILMEARTQLATLSSFACGAIADSTYNAKELAILGIEDVFVAPVIFPLAHRGVEDPSQREVADPVLLFVGRLAPNKRIETLVAALALLKRKWSRARLVIVGTPIVVEYHIALLRLVAALNLGHSVDFTGSISDYDRDSLYRNSTVYVSASAHEGFCVPVIEAMNAGLPVVAFNSSALPETLGDAGLLVDDDSVLAFAKAVDLVLLESELRAELVARGLKRASEFSLAKSQQRMRSVLESLLMEI